MSTAPGPSLRIVHTGKGQQDVTAVKGARCVVGRADQADLQLRSQGVSRRHAELFQDASGRWMVRDLGSSNGTLLNGTRITGDASLHHLDQMRIDHFEVTFLQPEGGAGSDDVPDLGMSMLDAGLEFADARDDRIVTYADLESPRVSAEQLRSILQLSHDLHTTADRAARRALLCRRVVGPPFHGLAALILRLDPETPGDSPTVVVEPVLQHGAQAPYLSQTLIREVAQKGVPAIASSTGSSFGRRDEEVLQMTHLGDSPNMAAVACPVGRSDSGLEILYVTLPAQFATAEWLALASLASEQHEQAQTIWEAREAAEQKVLLERELQKAHEIQTSLVPASFERHGLQVGFGFEPCHWVGGDYVDALEMGDGRQLLTVMDVCGKGLQAALVSAALHTAIHVLTEQGLSLIQVAAGLNAHMVKSLPAESFVTMILMALSPDTGAVEVVNCGHPPAFLVGRNGECRELGQTPFMPLGVLEVELESTRDELAPGEVLCAYSDGLFESIDQNEEMLGLDRLRDRLRSSVQSGSSADTIVDDLLRMVGEFSQGMETFDDLSLLVAIRQ